MHTAIITGASVGIGRATAQRFLALGYRVYNLSRRACPEDGVENIACDLASDASINAACSTLLPVVKDSETVCLLHNASQMRKDAVSHCSSDSLREVLETNVVALNSVNQLLLPALPAGSSLLYIGSTLSEKAVAGSFSYVLSKHAQLGMMRASCQDLMGTGIHTALICPGFTDTEMLRTHIGNNPEVVAAIGGMNAYGRLIDPGEIAELIVWAHGNPVINGAVLHANLGQKEA
ncbi:MULTISPECIES: SDR family oxidoreductase [Haliea]|jgi:NAD(P)-dependent dehydrogenase (short-subunit alcohol dehydrogenase family)|uniref:SDR family oxidoreductase n=1 Tax=Haliea TaxID=475794 RepID=UPI000421C423|nr:MULTISPECIES: SDR family oxidoreductase [Haliea]HCD54147.1 SDR family NAD(P)-dependent oxidoreductase [Halieaceae bacterium]MAD65088.1 NAD(P)-dependent oxidoreductase [Haliea sp.]MAY92849.1 NAD(P)-dependent oxidoreductase [Haliea sp.]MBK40336.1 NAD(P)-dependent oxidoreductase [Haliea sp.]MBP68947.1 NAD(P)-dependent oxidoreductase [Haliea sp.]|tara:strand:+ start:70409 stop:71110 length:702 start_codon:yes stop_codon:yes gene_type:complete